MNSRRPKDFVRIALLLGIVGGGSAIARPVNFEGYDGSAQARAAQHAAESRVKAAEQTIRDSEAIIRRGWSTYWEMTAHGADHSVVDQRIAKLKDDLSDLARRRAAAIEELREGLFCSCCGRTKSEILATGSVFPHPGCTILNETPAELAARIDSKNAEFDAEENGKRKMLADLLAQRKDEDDEWKQKLDAIKDGIRLAEGILNAARKERLDAAIESHRAEYAAAVLERLEAREVEARQDAGRRQDYEKRRQMEDALLDAEAERRNQEELVQEADYKVRLQEIAVAEARKDGNAEAERQAIASRDAAVGDERTAAAGELEAEKQVAALQRTLALAAPDSSSGDSETPAMGFTKQMVVKMMDIVEAKAVAAREFEKREAERLYHDRADVSRDLMGRLAAQYGNGASGWFQKIADGEQVLQNYSKWQQDGTLAEHLGQMSRKYADDLLASQLDYGPKTIDQTFSDTYEKAMRNLVAKDREPDSAFDATRLQLTDSLIDKAKDYAVEETRHGLLDSMTSLLFADKPQLVNPTGDSLVDKAEYDFERTVSTPNLIYDTFPFQGGRSILGLKRYLNETKESFFKYFGLATANPE